MIKREIPPLYYIALMASEAIPFIFYLFPPLRRMGQGDDLTDLHGKKIIVKALYI